jgi:hypothetical protein
MTTTIAQTLTLFSAAVMLLAAAAWTLLRRRAEARRVAQRIGVTFAVFGLAAGYVWLELGPDLDHRLLTRERPLLAQPGSPQEQEV